MLSTSTRFCLCTWFVAAACALPALAVEKIPSPLDDTEKPKVGKFGEEFSKLSLAVDHSSTAVQGGKIKLKLHLKNSSANAVKLKPNFAWLLVVRTAEEAFYTSKIQLPQQGVPFPEKVAGNSTVVIELDCETTEAYGYRKGVRLVQGYPQTAEDEEPIGRLIDQLQPNRFRMRAFLHLDMGRRELRLQSGTGWVQVDPVDLSTLKGPKRKDVVEALLDKFGKDAFAARDAHGQALKMGKEILPHLHKALKGKKRGVPGQMWLVKTVLDFRENESVPHIIKALDGPARNVIAYHAVHMKSAALDNAVARKAEESVDYKAAKIDPNFVSWAVRGYAQDLERFPKKLARAGMKSGDVRARILLPKVLVHQPGTVDAQDMALLLTDREAKIRAECLKHLAAKPAKAFATFPMYKSLLAILKSDKDKFVQKQQAAYIMSALSTHDMRIPDGASRKQVAAVAEAWDLWLRAASTQPTLKPDEAPEE